MADALLDTTVFIDYWRGDTGAKAVIESIVDSLRSGSVSAMTAIELWQYPTLGRAEEIQYRALLLLLEEAELDTETAVDVGQQLRSLSKNARRRRAADAIIARTAVRRGEDVYSRNRKDLSFFGATVHSY